MKKNMITIDGNEAVAIIAYAVNEVCAIYPITPSSGMGEWCDAWAAAGKKNIWGNIPIVSELQSEGGAAGTVHGSLQSGALTTTFTASQGLLLMYPNMFKIAGELTSVVFHVSARALAAQALSIFGDHSDVMAVRSTGFAMLCSNSVQEAMDFALISHAATLESRVPFLHFFDGFRTSHEVMKIEEVPEEVIREMMDEELIGAHRRRGLTPDKPVMRGTAQNPDVYFQGRETVNNFYSACTGIVQKLMNKFADLTGRQYHLFDYVGAPDAERVIVIMGSGAEAVEDTVNYLNAQGEKIGLVKVRLYRPFFNEQFLAILPKTVKSIAVLDRLKEPGSTGEPLYLDVVHAISESFGNGELTLSGYPKIIGGRYGLSSKEFTPAMVKAVFDELSRTKSKNSFTIGINDDVSHTSLEFDSDFSIESKGTFRGMFYGLGADGTVGANKNSIKIIGEETENYAQGYFVYDSKKSGSTTVSHLRFGPNPIKSTYLISKANFVACHQQNFLEQFDMLSPAEEGATFLLNTQIPKEEIWDSLPEQVQRDLITKKMKFYTIDGYGVAQATGMGGRVNSVMQTCFFAISNIMPREDAISAIKHAIEKTYGKKGEKIVLMNYAAVDKTIENLFEIPVPTEITSTKQLRPSVTSDATEFVQNFTATLISGKGDSVPVSMMPVDGTFPVGTAMFEKRNLALEIPAWDKEWCIQCNKCAIVCPHAAIRIKIYDENQLENAPASYQSMKLKNKDYGENLAYTVQVAPEDCTGCGICVEICPAKNKRETRLKSINMVPQVPIRDQERENYQFFLDLPEFDRRKLNVSSVKDSQFLQPLFEYSGACLGCGETPYVKLASQMFGDRMIVANATGCSSIYGGNLPTTPWTKNSDGRGPAWSNSLFEDNAEFGFGFRTALDSHESNAKAMLSKFGASIGDDLTSAILQADQSDEVGIFEQRERVMILKDKLRELNTGDAKHLLEISDYLVKKSVWIMGGDGWAYDIGFGGLDHVLASGKNVNILVLDTEVYSNTGGQMSKSTPMGAVAKFASGGKPTAKKDLALMATSYGNCYVARVAMGANDAQTVRAFSEAEQFNGPSLIIAYSHCIAHGIDIRFGMTQQRLAVECGHWILFRYNPDWKKEGKNPFKLDSKALKIPFSEYAYTETRYSMLLKSHPEEAKLLMIEAQKQISANWKHYEHLASLENNM